MIFLTRIVFVLRSCTLTKMRELCDEPAVDIDEINEQCGKDEHERVRNQFRAKSFLECSTELFERETARQHFSNS